MKIINYLYNVVRLGKLKIQGNFRGRIFQGIPTSTVVRAEKGILSIGGRLSCRNNSYICAGKGNLSIGEGCFINQNVMIVSQDNIEIGKDVLIGPNVVIVDHDHDYKGDNRKHTFVSAPIHIGDNVWIGANAVIMRGTKIGAGSVLGAGGVVKGEYPKNTLIFQEKEIKTRSIERGI